MGRLSGYLKFPPSGSPACSHHMKECSLLSASQNLFPTEHVLATLTGTWKVGEWVVLCHPRLSSGTSTWVAVSFSLLTMYVCFQQVPLSTGPRLPSDLRTHHLCLWSAGITGIQYSYWQKNKGKFRAEDSMGKVLISVSSNTNTRWTCKHTLLILTFRGWSTIALNSRLAWST